MAKAKIKIKAKEPLGLVLTKLILSTSLIVSVGALVGAVGYMASHPRIAPPISMAPDIPPPPSPTGVLAMDDWQTYQNEEYGFEIKFPQNFYTQEGKYENEKYRQYWIEAADSKWKDQQVHNPSLIIDVIKTDLKPKEYLDITGSSKSILDDISPCPVSFTYCSLKYLEFTGIGAEQIPSLQFYSAAVSGSDYHTVVRNGDFLIDIRAHSSGNGDFAPVIYNQVLSTFKFIGKPCQQEDAGERIKCFTEYINKNPISDDIINSDDKLKKYFSENLADLKFTGISRGNFDKFYDKDMILVSMDWNAGKYGKSYIFILKENLKKSWDVRLLETDDYIRFVNKPEKLIKNEAAFFIGQDTRSGGTCTSVSWKNIIYKLENGKFENIWSTDFYFVDQGEQPEFPAKINDKTNTVVIDTELIFKDTNGDGNKEIIRQGTKKIWKGYCNGGGDEDVMKIEKIYEAYKWNSQKQTFIKMSI